MDQYSVHNPATIRKQIYRLSIVVMNITQRAIFQDTIIVRVIKNIKETVKHINYLLDLLIRTSRYNNTKYFISNTDMIKCCLS